MQIPIDNLIEKGFTKKLSVDNLYVPKRKIGSPRYHQ